MIKNEPLLSEETLAKIKREITVQEAKAAKVAKVSHGTLDKVKTIDTEKAFLIFRRGSIKI